MNIEMDDDLFENDEFSNAIGKGRFKKMRAARKAKRAARKANRTPQQSARRAKWNKRAGYIPHVAAYRGVVKAFKKRKARRSGFDGDDIDGTDFNMNF
jgi:hypothetical protein